MTEDIKEGASLKNNQTSFCVHAPNATKVELCLFSDDEKTETRIPMEKDDSGKWLKSIDCNLEGKKYGYRADGTYAPESLLFFNPNKLLIDPYAYEITKSLYNVSTKEKEMFRSYCDADTSFIAPKSIVRFLDKKTLAKKYPYLYQKPNIEWGKNHIYELHVNNFSKLHPDIREEARGKLEGISLLVDYFKQLNYNQIELMPITPTMSDWQLEKDKGLFDSWGYNPITHHAVDPRYGNIYDFLELVNTLHKHNIEINLDMVFNHTGEFAANDFLLSYKGLDARSYYRYSQFDGHSFINTSGCKNGFNPNTAKAADVIRSSLTFFADVCGVDAFRFDLAGDCALDENLNFQPQSNFVKIIKEVSEKTGVKLSGEPWSAIGGYFLGEMPDIYEWNDRHEKSLRKFIRGEKGQVNTLAYYMAGGEVKNKVNIFTKHDGATMYDWATYHEKNNFENNENNVDGSNDNHYSPSRDDEERLTKTNTAHALNTLARGVPLSLSGDEILHSQGGNNNGYAKSFPLQWQNLTPIQKEHYMFERKVNAFRQAHQVFSSVENASSEIMPNGTPSWEWVNIYGYPMEKHDWDFQDNRFLAYVLNGENKEGKRFDDDFVVMTSGNPDGEMYVKLPRPPHGGRWQLVFDTSKPSNHKDATRYQEGANYILKPHSLAVFTSKRDDEQKNKALSNTLLSLMQYKSR
ncbi:MAG: hypothetical protein IKW39_05975 [Alphaproteobacteria bacterium]|nr:hypothetical protein [Alphaproteobacteria bacterium]